MTERKSANAIQPIGLHVRLGEDWRVRAISANTVDLLGAAAADLIDLPITTLFEADTVHSIRNRIALLRDGQAVGQLFNCQFDRSPNRFDLTVSRAGNGYAIDTEPSPGQPFTDPAGVADGMAATLDRCDSDQAIRDMAVRQIRGLTGFEHVEVQIGRQAAGVPPLGRGMMIVDCRTDGVAMVGADDDLDGSMLRTPSKAEIELYCGGGMQAALVLPLTGSAGPIGRIFCTHHWPRHVGAERRSVASLFARFVALRLAAADRA